MARVKFLKGEQRKFLRKVLENLNCPSLRALRQFGFDVSYSTLKNYFNENRTLPENFFQDLCFLSGINSNGLKVNFLEENWGQRKGGRISSRRKVNF